MARIAGCNLPRLDLQLDKLQMWLLVCQFADQLVLKAWMGIDMVVKIPVVQYYGACIALRLSAVGHAHPHW